jgi:photosystem II stability/assembly factor-like uncharacterized protein
MKYIKILIGIAVLTISNKSYSQWTEQFNNSDWIHAVYFLDNDTGYAASWGGKIYNTTDGGVTWVEQLYDNQAGFNDLFFYNSEVGYAVGYNSKIYKTINGGLTWTELSGVPAGDYEAINCPNIDTCFVCGLDNVIKTTDGGNNWQTVFTVPSGSLFGIDFLNTNYGFITGNQTYKTTDGGSNWNEVSNLANYDIQFYNENIGYAIAFYDTLRKTTDGGLSWTNIPTGSDHYLADIQVLSEDLVFVACTTQVFTVIKTNDGGNNFFIQDQTSDSIGLNKIFLLNGSTGWAVGLSGIYHTQNGGGAGLPLEINQNEKIDLIKISVFPNPINKEREINIKSNEKSKINLYLYNYIGQPVDFIANLLLEKGTNTLKLDSDLVVGFYTVVVETENERHEFKLMLIE